MNTFEINYLAIAAAAAINFFLGGLWYSPKLFGKTWMTLLGITEEECKSNSMAKCMGTSAICAVIMSIALACIIGVSGATGILAGAKKGLLVWLGFVATVQIQANLYEKRPMKLFWINTGYYAVALILMGALIASWH